MPTIVAIVVAIYAWYYRNKISKTVNVDSYLTKDEKINVLICIVFSPVLAQAIFYYGWNKKLPLKAKQSNKYGWVYLGILVLVVIGSLIVAEIYTKP